MVGRRVNVGAVRSRTSHQSKCRSRVYFRQHRDRWSLVRSGLPAHPQPLVAIGTSLELELGVGLVFWLAGQRLESRFSSVTKSERYRSCLVERRQLRHGRRDRRHDCLALCTLFLWRTSIISADPELKKLTSEENPVTHPSVLSIRSIDDHA